MRFLLLLLSFSAFVCAQLATIPNCATDCLSTALASSSCSSGDVQCICNDINNVWNAATPCINAACSASDIQTFGNTVGSLCISAGVTVSLPTATAVGGLSSTEDATTTTMQAAASSRGATAMTVGLLPGSAVNIRQSTSSEVDASTTTHSAADTSPTTSSSTNSSQTTATGQSSTATGTQSGGGDSKTPIGAIVGGVIGGLALLCIAGVAVFYIKRRHPRPPRDPAQDTSQLPKYEYSSAPEVVQPGQTAAYYPQAASQSVEAPGYGHQPSELGGRYLGGHAAAHELPSVRK